MMLKQYYLGCLAHASYLIADEETKTAVVVDPQRDIDQYLADAERQGCRFAMSSSRIFMPTFWPGTWNCATGSGHRSCSGHGRRRTTRFERSTMAISSSLVWFACNPGNPGAHPGGDFHSGVRSCQRQTEPYSGAHG